MSKNRSPREVCSMTEGMTRFVGWLLMFLGSLTAGGPEFRVGLLLFLFGRPDRVARLRELLRDPLHLGRDPVERVAQPDVVAERLDAAVVAELRERLLGIVPRELGLLADERLDLLVRDVDVQLVRGSLED